MTTVVQSIAISSVGSPSIAIRPPWVMFAIISRSAAGLPGHLQADVEALAHAELALRVGEARRADVDGAASTPMPPRPARAGTR